MPWFADPCPCQVRGCRRLVRSIDDGDGIGYQRSQFERAIQTRDERSQIAIVDADDLSAAIEDARELIRIVEFDEDVQPDLHRVSVELRQFLSRQNLGD